MKVIKQGEWGIKTVEGIFFTLTADEIRIGPPINSRQFMEDGKVKHEVNFANVISINCISQPEYEPFDPANLFG